jgi:hypothetical protein
MNNLLSVFLITGMIIIAQVNSFPQGQDGMIPSKTVNDSGADVQIFTVYGKQFNGELLSVRENSLMIFNSSACKDNTKQWECVDQVRKNEIEKLIIEGNSNVGLGLGLGSAAGLFSLVFTTEKGGFGLPQSKYSDDVTGGVMLGCIIVGGVIGILTSTADEEIEPFSEYDISGLSVYAKYPYEEPRDLEKIK